MRKLFAILVINICVASISAANWTSNTKVVLDSLDWYLANRDTNDKATLILVRNLKSDRDVLAPDNWKARYTQEEKIFQRYQFFMNDSALESANRLVEISQHVGSSDYIVKAQLRLGFMMLSSGLFKETLDLLQSIDYTNYSKPQQVEYFLILGRCYHDLALYDKMPKFTNAYNRLGNSYVNKAMALMDSASLEFQIQRALVLLKADNLTASQKVFESICNNPAATIHDQAIMHSTLGHLYSLQGEKDKAIQHLGYAAICDLKMGVKEGVALRNLAQLFYNYGEIKFASRYIRSALDDAQFYNARHRKLEVGNVLPIIEDANARLLESQTQRIVFSLVGASILGLIAICLAALALYQYSKIKRVKDLLVTTNLNLKESNKRLSESIRIKEKYIGFYFNLNSNYIERLEKIQKALLRKIASRQIDDLQDYLRKELLLENERDTLNGNFDKVFLSLFPNFVSEFNKFFAPEDQFVLGDTYMLNTDLRIFALIRMGITDNEVIAKILNYSVNTIYTYKTKIKNKSHIQNDDFEAAIMQIDS